MKEERYYHYKSLVDHGNSKKFAVISIIFHGLILASFFIWSLVPFFHTTNETIPPVMGGGGGFGPGDTIGAGLEGGSPEGDDWFKQPLKKIDPPKGKELSLPEPAKIEKVKPTEKVEEKDDKEEKEDSKNPEAFESGKTKNKKEIKTNSKKEKEKKAIVKTDKSKSVESSKPTKIVSKQGTAGISTGTAEKYEGVKDGKGGFGGGQGAGVGGSGGGVALGIGGGLGPGPMDWYQREVFKRISSNWQKPLMGVEFPGKQVSEVKIYIRDDGTFDVLRIEKSTSPAYERWVLNALERSNPLPPLPENYRNPMKRVFTIRFDWPPNSD